ncbi:helix-turn-helix transcriptional regulator [Streptomyces sp. Go40/10]|uniref:helix-turn-helix domain-containing protein n=1 Tax=Streptomyces sp. Go40/10 TaxID=2825844 RepID=UPI001E2BB52A|nr:helix-turn-helix transcriptional regulator [Streptomyces sp. Go40/10]UFR07087.1 helix-turn-helix transcriptional regulator [Streptomyces sp. Go40/10]
MPGQVLALVGGQEPPTTPNAAARLVGLVLRHLRLQRGYNQAHVAGQVAGINSVPMLSRYEKAKVKNLKEETVIALCRFYEAPEGIVEETAALVRQSQRQDWWAGYTDVVGDVLARLFAVESSSKGIRTYQEIHIPGMLQTAGYMRAVMRDYYRTQADERTRRKNEETVERRLWVRLQRQHLLDQPDAPYYEALIAESVLGKAMGGRLVMREQLRQLYNVAENKPNVHIRILPSSALQHGGALHPAMTLFKPQESDEGRLVYLENTNRGGEYLTLPGEVEPYQASLDDLWMRTGTKRDALALLQKYIDQLVDEDSDDVR